MFLILRNYYFHWILLFLMLLTYWRKSIPFYVWSILIITCSTNTEKPTLIKHLYSNVGQLNRDCYISIIFGTTLDSIWFWNLIEPKENYALSCCGCYGMFNARDSGSFPILTANLKECHTTLVIQWKVYIQKSFRNTVSTRVILITYNSSTFLLIRLCHKSNFPFSKLNEN